MYDIDDFEFIDLTPSAEDTIIAHEIFIECLEALRTAEEHPNKEKTKDKSTSRIAAILYSHIEYLKGDRYKSLGAAARADKVRSAIKDFWKYRNSKWCVLVDGVSLRAWLHKLILPLRQYMRHTKTKTSVRKTKNKTMNKTLNKAGT